MSCITPKNHLNTLLKDYGFSLCKVYSPSWSVSTVLAETLASL